MRYRTNYIGYEESALDADSFFAMEAYIEFLGSESECLRPHFHTNIIGPLNETGTLGVLSMICHYN